MVLKWPSRFYQLLLQGEILIPRPSRADKQLFLVEKLLWSCEFSCFNKLHEASRFFFLWLFYFFAESQTLIKEKLLNWSSICFSKVSHSPHTIMKYFSQIHVETLLGPLEIILSEVCSYSQTEHSRVTMNMKLSSHGFLFHGNINERESKAQIPLNSHNYEKPNNIFLMCRKS